MVKGVEASTHPQEPVLSNISVVEAKNMGSPIEIVAKEACAENEPQEYEAAQGLAINHQVHE